MQASDDYVDLQFGTDNGMTTITLQWVAGADDTVGALGIDKLFINNTSSTLEVAAVYVNSIVAGNDVSGDWGSGPNTAHAGSFGLFIENVAEPGGVGGIDPDTLIFVLNGIYTEGSFVPNADGASFAAHLRYNNGCSGWVADGGTPGDGGSDSNCGGAPVPEPSAALAFGAGVLVVGSAIRRRKS